MFFQEEDSEPLGPGDDVSDDEDNQHPFETENVVVCQFDRVRLFVYKHHCHANVVICCNSLKFLSYVLFKFTPDHKK